MTSIDEPDLTLRGAPRHNWWPRSLEPPRLQRRQDSLAPVLALEIVLLVVVLVLLTVYPVRTPYLILGTVLVSMALALVPIGHRPLAAWVTLLRRWLSRRRRMQPINRNPQVLPLTAISPELSTGSIPGPHRSEIGILHDGVGWATALWVTEGPRADPENPDPLGALWQLPMPLYPATRHHVVLQQCAPLDGQSPQATAWLAIKVDPMRHLTTRAAVGAVPALLRSELHRVIRSTHTGLLTLMALDRRDLVGALAASTELPLDPLEGFEDTSENWTEWSARGRHHHCFAVRASDADAPMGLVGALLNQAQSVAGSTVTITIARESEVGRLADFPIMVRVSHPAPGRSTRLARDLRRVSRQLGGRVRSLHGNQGPALLHTSVLAGQHLA